MSSSPIRIGTRASTLALWQAHFVADRLRDSGIQVEIIHISTQGDTKSGPIGAIGTQGVFTKEIQRALLDEEIDLAVHSLKDLPTERVQRLCLAAVPPRESPGDALVTEAADLLDTLPQGSRIGTGSARRRSQLLHHRPDLVVEDIRGNVDTRLRKLDDGQFDAIVLAEAGLLRLGLEARIRCILPREIMLPAVGQGALGLETRADDEATRAAVAPLDDQETHQAVVAERSMLRHLRGGCLAPVGAWTRVEAGQLRLDGVVLHRDGSHRVYASDVARGGDDDDPEELGRRVAEALFEQGAAELIAASRDGT